eukprot:6373121-Pyramimonas_sp.AAC.1
MRANLSTRLVAFRNRSGGLWPIACGSVLRRLAAGQRATCSRRTSKPRAGHTSTPWETQGAAKSCASASRRSQRKTPGAW